MIYLKFLCFILLISFLSSIDSQPVLSLRQKLERLLQDPEYDDANNEISKPHQIHGMLLKDIREHGLFDTSSEEGYFGRLKTLKKSSEEQNNSGIFTTSMKKLTTTTTTAPINLGSAKNTTTAGQKSTSTMGGIESLSSLILRFIDMFTK